ncbi:MAG: hypothetical protein H6696_09465 [Deferribacteres bacterium]|nr:hypothetical protein [candidate division KSB1 bacterium]MCB9502155.1 hypothetical protein [Deferribacteres bacterium]
MKIYDEHIHLRPHADEPPAHQLAPYVAMAKERGIEISIKEHALLPEKYRTGPRKDFDFAMAPEEYEPFLQLFTGSETPIGLEVDYIAGCEDEIRAMVADFLQRVELMGLHLGALNGSVHLLPLDISTDPKNPQMVMWDDFPESFEKYVTMCGIEKIIEEYHRALCGLVNMQFFEVLSHIDLLRKFDSPDKNGTSRYFAGFENFYEEAIFDVLQLAKENGIAVELNTQGIDRSYGKPFLTQRALQFCHDSKINLTFASDAHKPQAIGAHFKTAGHMFARAGVEKLTYFRNRRPAFYDYR